MRYFFKSLILAVVLLPATAVLAIAEVSIEATVSSPRVELGDQISLDIIVTNAEGRIEPPKIGTLDGFTAYSQGHSQEISIINGVSSSRSIFSYTLLANAVGKKTIGPIDVMIGGKPFKVAPVEVDVVVASGATPSRALPQSTVSAPPARALPSEDVSDQDIFVRAWLDKDEVYVNEPALLTYTLYTRLPATYKGFEKEAVTTGFWVEDFPPEKTIRRTEKIINNSRYVVADVRKLALFPTQAGVFSMEPGSLAVSVELRNQDPFDSFMSSNVFGRRSFPVSVLAQVVNKEIIIDPIKITVKALPELDKPAGFGGAVGSYLMEGGIDKNEVQAGDPVTYRIRVWGQGNFSTLEMPKVPALADFKIYDASSSVNISKDKLIVEGEKVSETVMVPKKAGKYTIPPVTFAYYDLKDKTYRLMKTEPQSLTVTGAAEADNEEPSTSSEPSSSGTGIEPASKENVAMQAKDIRYIKNAVAPKAISGYNFYQKPYFWALQIFFLVGWVFCVWLASRDHDEAKDMKGRKSRRSHWVARKKLRAASKLLKEEKQDAFYAEIERALYSYFADKLGISSQAVSLAVIEERTEELSADLYSRIKTIFHELSSGRYGRQSKSIEQMKETYDQADDVITSYEKVKIKS